MSDDYGQEQAIRKLKPGKLVIASHNAGKVREIAALLGPYGIEPIAAASLDLPEPEETGTTFIANAELKAMQAADLSGLPARVPLEGGNLVSTFYWLDDDGFLDTHILNRKLSQLSECIYWICAGNQKLAQRLKRFESG